MTKIHIGFHRLSVWAPSSPICDPRVANARLIYLRKDLRKVTCKRCRKMNRAYNTRAA